MRIRRVREKKQLGKDELTTPPDMDFAAPRFVWGCLQFGFFPAPTSFASWVAPTISVDFVDDMDQEHPKQVWGWQDL
jgi:hypothetical protein